MLFNTRVNIFRKEFLIKDSIYEVENDISIYIVHKVITIILYSCHIQVHLSGKLHPCGDATSEPYKPTFLIAHLMAVLQPSGYSIFHGRDTPIQLSLP